MFLLACIDRSSLGGYLTERVLSRSGLAFHSCRLPSTLRHELERFGGGGSHLSDVKVLDRTSAILVIKARREPLRRRCAMASVSIANHGRYIQ